MADFWDRITVVFIVHKSASVLHGVMESQANAN